MSWDQITETSARVLAVLVAFRTRVRLKWFTPAAGTFALVLFPLAPGVAATSCDASMPASKAQVYDLKPSTTIYKTVGEAELKKLSATADTTIFHNDSVMVGVSTIASAVFVEHNVVKPESGLDAFCDAPKLVRIGIGFSHRIVYLARAAAADPCARSILIEHAAKHAKAEDDLVDAIIDENTGAFGSELAQLKHTAASSSDLAVSRFEAGIRGLVQQILGDLLARKTKLHQSIDSEDETTRLRSSCTGRLKGMDKKIGI